MTDIATKYTADPGTEAYFADKRARNAAVVRNVMKAGAARAEGEKQVEKAFLTLAYLADEETLDWVMRSLRI